MIATSKEMECNGCGIYFLESDNYMELSYHELTHKSYSRVYCINCIKKIREFVVNIKKLTKN